MKAKVISGPIKFRHFDVAEHLRENYYTIRKPRPIDVFKVRGLHQKAMAIVVLKNIKHSKSHGKDKIK